jgi:LacI family transcriptional regulator
MNLRQLSSLLQLSQTTVSRALNGFPEVSEGTRARVKAAADLHGYRPSAAARRLATGQSGTLGMIFPAERNLLGDLLFTEFLSGCVEKAADLGYDMTLAMARGSTSEEAVYRRSVRSARVDAMILSSPLIADPRPKLLHGLGMPFIVHGRTATTTPYAYLDIDNEGAFHAAARLLTDLGHRRIALLNGEVRYNFAADRERGFRAALARRGITPIEGFVCEDPMNEETAFAQVHRLLALELPPTAFLCSSIAQAMGVQRACGLHSRRIGRDIAVIAHDDGLPSLRAESFDPPLSTTQSAIGDAGRQVVELIIGILQEPEAPLPAQVWPVDLVVRGSTPAPV